VRTSINKAKIAREEASYNLEQTKLDLNKEIQQAYLDAVSALKNFNAAEKKVQAQREAFKYAEQRFDVGLLNSVEYNETKKELTKAESELLQAKYNYIFTTTVLDFYMGRPLSIEN
jgi:outer membrane protein